MFATMISASMVAALGLVCAICVGCCLRSLSLAREIRSLHSLQSEIVEIDACVRSLMLTIRRMEGRQTARMGRTSSPESDSLSLMDKDALRRYAGILPGKPVRHQNGDDSRDSA